MTDLPQEERDRIGRWRRARRIEAGFRSQKALADRATVSVDTVNNAELGRPLMEDTVRALALAVGCDVGAYATGGAPAIEPPIAAEVGK